MKDVRWGQQRSGREWKTSDSLWTKWQNSLILQPSRPTTCWQVRHKWCNYQLLSMCRCLPHWAEGKNRKPARILIKKEFDLNIHFGSFHVEWWFLFCPRCMRWLIPWILRKEVSLLHSLCQWCKVCAWVNCWLHKRMVRRSKRRRSPPLRFFQWQVK